MKGWRPPKIWAGGNCWIIGGGPSIPRQFNVPETIIEKVTEGKLTPNAYSEYMQAIHNEHIIGINNAYQIGNWIDICFFGDKSWYLLHREALNKEFGGLRVSCASYFNNKKGRQLEGVKYMPRKRPNSSSGISMEPGVVCWNANSGACSISLACQLGVKKIYLLGFDMTLGTGKESHWHNRPGQGFVPKEKREKQYTPTYAKHLRGFPKIAEDAKKLGVEIINLSPESKIEVLPKSTVSEVLEGWKK